MLEETEAAVRALPGTYEYRWLRSDDPTPGLRAYGRFADASSASLAARLAAARLSRIGVVISQPLLPVTAPNAAGRRWAPMDRKRTGAARADFPSSASR